MDVQETRPRWRFNAAYGITDRLLGGLEVNPAAGEVVATANYILGFESVRSPMVAIGTSSDRIFSPPGAQSYYITVARSLGRTGIAPYGSFSWSEWEDTLLFTFGLNWALASGWEAMLQHDGRNTHWILTYKVSGLNLSLLVVKGESLGVSAGVQF